MDVAEFWNASVSVRFELEHDVCIFELQLCQVGILAVKVPRGSYGGHSGLSETFNHGLDLVLRQLLVSTRLSAAAAR